MEVEAFLADAVQASGGKLSALGIGWQVLSAPGFPVRHDRIGIGVLVRLADEGEQGRHRLSVRLLGPTGEPRPLGRSPDGSEVRELTAPFEVRGSPGSATFALNFDGLVFEEPGTYAFVIEVDGAERKRLAFRVQRQPAPAPAEVSTGGYL
ncbi:MAG: hypothetical protein KatS3mg014_2282 [Actinomycetota bacterium]|nr:MAG: hypothetical protein KatS3mg014_2282 [Actinomycetota bacterium]